MCGITGLVALTSCPTDEMHNTLSNITKSIVHRGPDAHQIWCDKVIPLALGHRRLAIIDLTDDGLQPMHSHDGRYTIVFNGEFYNFQEIKNALSPHRPSFRGHSDTEIILSAISIWGLDKTIEKVRGMYAFALWDKTEKRLHLVRDRLGKKPLYIGYAGDNLVFASELKVFCAHPEFKRTINPNTKALFIKYGYIPAPYTIYQNIWHLPPAHIISLDYDQIQKKPDIPSHFKCYWNTSDIAKQKHAHPITKSKTETITEFTKLLASCVEERMISDVPLGAFLSGGLDSSTIVALMQKISSQPVKTYTIGFEQKGYDEAQHAKTIATHLGTDHHEHILTGREALDVIPKLPQMYDEPFADISAIPTYLVSKFARQDVTVALSGDGGDEMLGGYQRYLSAPSIWNKTKNIPRPIKNIINYLIKSFPPEIWDKTHPKYPQFGERLYKATSILHQSSQKDVYDRILSQCDNPVEWIDGGVIPQNLHNQHIAGGSFAEDMMLNDALFYLPYDILTKVDRATMAVSLESRAPLLDSRIFEYVWNLPENYKIRDGQGKWLLRQVLKHHVPEELYTRPKQGFTIPVGEWLRNDLREWAEDLLSAEKLTENGLNTNAIRKLWNNHLKGQGGHAVFLWTIITYQAWHKEWSLNE